MVFTPSKTGVAGYNYTSPRSTHQVVDGLLGHVWVTGAVTVEETVVAFCGNVMVPRHNLDTGSTVDEVANNTMFDTAVDGQDINHAVRLLWRVHGWVGARHLLAEFFFIGLNIMRIVP